MKNIVRMNQTKTLGDKKHVEFYSDTDRLTAYSVDYLMENDNEAISLHLDNLILTYGIEKVTAALNIAKKQLKKVA